MIIEVYKSALCPRCAYALQALKKLQANNKDIEIITYDILTDLIAFKKAGVKMIPSIKIQNEIKSWIIPKATDIENFVSKHTC